MLRPAHCFNPLRQFAAEIGGWWTHAGIRRHDRGAVACRGAIREAFAMHPASMPQQAMGEILIPVMGHELQLLRGRRGCLFAFKNTRAQKLHTVNNNMLQPF